MKNHALLATFLLACLEGVAPAGAECTESHDSPLVKAAAAGYAPVTLAVLDSTNKWGYGYADLKEDLAVWARNPYVKVDSIGASAENRGIWMLTVTDEKDSIAPPDNPGWRKRRIFVHARTHPAEVQAHHITREILQFLLDSTEQAWELRRDYIWNLIPMYNPDGVEKGLPRQNANNVDIESNWNNPKPEVEVLALRETFRRLMASTAPVEVALNLHSDRFNCTRFFFFHEAKGTSPAFVELEKDFIGRVQAHFPSGIENWHFVRSWGDTTGFRYPEGFWWANHQEKVMALTYEDANCPNADEFDRTARALVLGSVDYLRARPASLRSLARTDALLLRGAGGLWIRDAGGSGWNAWSLADPLGRVLASGRFEGVAAFIPDGARPPGAAVLRLSGRGQKRNLLLSGIGP